MKREMIRHPTYRLSFPKEELWEDIPGYHRLYQVSTQGRVRSLDRRIPNSIGSGMRLMRGQILSPVVDKNPGYPVVGLSKSGVVCKFSIHILVLNTFVGPCPEGMECRHLDDSKLNNRLENLCWGTSQENKSDLKRNGRGNQGSRNHFAKIDEEDVRIIRQLRKEGHKGPDIARRFGISGFIVWAILKGKTWKEV